MSGGPIYVSDDPARTRPEILAPLVLDDGRVLRADEPGQVLRRMLLRDPSLEAVPLLVGAPVVRGGVRAAVIAAFHVHKSAARVTGALCAEDIEALGLTLPAVVFVHGGDVAVCLTLDTTTVVPILGPGVDKLVWASR